MYHLHFYYDHFIPRVYSYEFMSLFRRIFTLQFLEYRYLTEIATVSILECVSLKSSLRRNVISKEISDTILIEYFRLTSASGSLT